MANYNLTFMDNTTSLLGIAQGIGSESGGWLGGTFILFFFVLFFMVFKNYDTKDVVLADSFITSILAGLLFGSGLLSAWVLSFPIILLVISLIYKLASDG